MINLFWIHYMQSPNKANFQSRNSRLITHSTPRISGNALWGFLHTYPCLPLWMGGNIQQCKNKFPVSGIYSAVREIHFCCGAIRNKTLHWIITFVRLILTTCLHPTTSFDIFLTYDRVYDVLSRAPCLQKVKTQNLNFVLLKMLTRSW